MQAQRCSPGPGAKHAPKGQAIVARAVSTHAQLGRFGECTAASWQDLPLKHVLDSQQFNRQSLDVIFEEALRMEKVRKYQIAQERGRLTHLSIVMVIAVSLHWGWLSSTNKYVAY